MTSISFGLACIGFVLLSLSMKRHYQQVWPQNAGFPRWSLPNRVAGYLLVGLSLIPCVKLDGFGIGLVLWMSILAAAAFLQAMLLTYFPQRSLLFSGVGLLLIVVGWLS
ncbi:MAG: DUF3325 domain-containing protein [Pseudomonadota bacterium]